jgi:hypothetical protein
MVDWWFIIKENNGLRYIYFDSKMAKEAEETGKKPAPLPV